MNEAAIEIDGHYAGHGELKGVIVITPDEAVREDHAIESESFRIGGTQRTNIRQSEEEMSSMEAGVAATIRNFPIKPIANGPEETQSSSLWYQSWGLSMYRAETGKKGGRVQEKGQELQRYTSYENVLAGRVSGNTSPLPADVSLCVAVEATMSVVQRDSAVHDELVSREAEKANISRGCRACPQGMTLKFVNVGCEVLKRKHEFNWPVTSKREVAKQILQGITGSVGPGEMLALMGPSGSGKTTLLNVLACRKTTDNHKATGEITYNGAPFSKFMKRRMAFVTQDDMLYPHLTVKETLTYAALLRLPASMTKKEKTEVAEQVIRQLGLERCRDTLIGSTFLRGISGGERKRVCIGHEMLINPSIIFLDEPTSGLDSTTALRIIQLLQKLAQSGRAVVTTIHQPSSRLFGLFDKMLLLAEGRAAYFGAATRALLYFESIGFSPLIAMNPADFLLDVCSGNTSEMSLPPLLQKHHEEVACRDVLQYVWECFEVGSKQQQAHAKVATTMQQTTSNEEERAWPTTWATQVVVLLKRGVRERRHDYLSRLRIIQIMAVAVLCGSLWLHSSSQTADDLRDQAALLFFIAVFWGYIPLFNAIFTFPLDRALLDKERASDMYRLSAYFLARLMADLPLDLLLPFLFITVVYFMANLRMTIAAFSLTMLTVFLTVITAQGVGLLIGATFTDLKKSTTFGSVLVIAFMLVGGFYVHRIPTFISWVKYISIQSYSYRLLLKIQYGSYYNINCYTGSDRDTMMDKKLITEECDTTVTLTKALQGMVLTLGAQEVWALLLMAFMCRVLAYVALHRVRLA